MPHSYSWERPSLKIQSLYYYSKSTFWSKLAAAAAAAKSLQSCPTLCDPIDGSPSGSTVPEILQARTLEWDAISFCNAGKWKVKVKSLSRVRLLATPRTAAHQAPPSMGFSRQEYWDGVPSSSPQEAARSRGIITKIMRTIIILCHKVAPFPSVSFFRLGTWLDYISQHPLHVGKTMWLIWPIGYKRRWLNSLSSWFFKNFPPVACSGFHLLLAVWG